MGVEAVRRPIDTTIDKEKCTGCGECVRVCPSFALEMKDGAAAVTGAWSLGCGHCAAVCPADAVTVGFVDEGALDFAALEGQVPHVAPGEFDALSLAGLMGSRRSCRNYLDRHVSGDLLEDLVRIGTTAPSGTNSQLWTFTLVPDRSSVMKLAEAVADFYRGLNRKASNPALRLLARIFLKDALGSYYRDYFESVREGLRRFDEKGEDLLFHGAPALIIVGSAPGASCPAEDALLASGQILLAAHALGLGTCMVNFAVEALRRDASISSLVGMAAGEEVHAVITVGYPDEIYCERAGRRRVRPRYFRA